MPSHSTNWIYPFLPKTNRGLDWGGGALSIKKSLSRFRELQKLASQWYIWGRMGEEWPRKENGNLGSNELSIHLFVWFGTFDRMKRKSFHFALNQDCISPKRLLFEMKEKWNSFHNPALNRIVSDQSPMTSRKEILYYFERRPWWSNVPSIGICYKHPYSWKRLKQY